MLVQVFKLYGHYQDLYLRGTYISKISDISAMFQMPWSRVTGFHIHIRGKSHISKSFSTVSTLLNFKSKFKKWLSIFVRFKIDRQIPRCRVTAIHIDAYSEPSSDLNKSSILLINAPRNRWRFAYFYLPVNEQGYLKFYYQILLSRRRWGYNTKYLDLIWSSYTGKVHKPSKRSQLNNTVVKQCE